jgi:retinol dehydrogenase 12
MIRFASEGIISVAVHPGPVSTELPRGVRSHGYLASLASRWLIEPFSNTFLCIDAEHGAITQLYAGTSSEVIEKNLNGKYLIPYCIEWKPTKFAEDEELAKKLWSWMENEFKSKL